MGLLHDLDDGKKRRITEEDYDYFLDAVPPVAFNFHWNNEKWNFGFAEGGNCVYAFQKQGGKYFAQKTNLLNPCECGLSIDDQNDGFAAQLRRRKKEPRVASWIPAWLKIGKRNAFVRRANDPPFNAQSFQACAHDDELLDKFAQGNWRLGQAFYRGDLCFIQQQDGGDKWLAIKQDTPFESISFGRIIRDHGRDAAHTLLGRLRTVSVERFRELEQ
jgi:hypothetical protein